MSQVKFTIESYDDGRKVRIETNSVAPAIHMTMEQFIGSFMSLFNVSSVTQTQKAGTATHTHEQAQTHTHDGTTHSH